MSRPPLTDDDGEVRELTAEDIRQMRPAGEVLPGRLDPEVAAALLKRRPGQRGPQKSPTKRLISLRLDQDVIAHFRATGPGWQSRINEALRRAIAGEPPPGAR